MGKKTIEEMWNANPYWRRHPIEFVSIVVRIEDGKPVRKKPKKYSWPISKKESARRAGIKIFSTKELAKKLGIKI